MSPHLTIDRPYKGGQNIRVHLEGRIKSPGMGREEKRMDLGGHMETR